MGIKATCLTCHKDFYPKVPSQPYKFCCATCYHQGQKEGLTSHKYIKPIWEPKQWTQQLAYLIGVILGDGNIHQNKAVRIYVGQDEPLADRLVALFEFLGLPAKRNISYTPSFQKSGYKPQLIIISYSAPFARFIQNLSLNYLEQNLITSPLKMAFVRGLFDAEGSIWQPKSSSFRLRIGMKNEKLLRLCKDLLEQEGFTPSLQVHKDGKQVLWIHKHLEAREFIKGTIKSWHVRDWTFKSARLLIQTMTDRMAELYEQGLSTRCVAKQLGITNSSVWYYMSKLGKTRSQYEAIQLYHSTRNTPALRNN